MRILQPVGGSFRRGSQIRLRALARDPEEGPIQGERWEYRQGGQGRWYRTGAVLETEQLSLGLLEIRFTAWDAHGEEGQEIRSVQLEGDPQRNYLFEIDPAHPGRAQELLLESTDQAIAQHRPSPSKHGHTQAVISYPRGNFGTTVPNSALTRNGRGGIARFSLSPVLPVLLRDLTPQRAILSSPQVREIWELAQQQEKGSQRLWLAFHGADHGHHNQAALVEPLGPIRIYGSAADFRAGTLLAELSSAQTRPGTGAADSQSGGLAEKLKLLPN